MKRKPSSMFHNEILELYAKQKGTKQDLGQNLSDEERLEKYEEWAFQDKDEREFPRSYDDQVRFLVLAVMLAKHLAKGTKANELVKRMVSHVNKIAWDVPKYRLNALGKLYEGLGLSEPAIFYYEEAFNYLDAARVSQAAGFERRARINYQLILSDLDEESSRGFQTEEKRGEIYVALGDIATAKQLYLVSAKRKEADALKQVEGKSFCRDSYDYSDWFIEAGHTFMSAGRIKDALRCYKRAPHTSYAYELEAEVFHQKKEWEKLVNLCLDHNDYEKAYDVLIRLDESQKAVAICRKAAQFYDSEYRRYKVSSYRKKAEEFSELLKKLQSGWDYICDVNLEEGTYGKIIVYKRLGFEVHLNGNLKKIDRQIFEELRAKDKKDILAWVFNSGFGYHADIKHEEGHVMGGSSAALINGTLYVAGSSVSYGSLRESLVEKSLAGKVSKIVFGRGVLKQECLD